MNTPNPAILITLQGPGGAVDIAARTDRAIHELVTATATILGMPNAPIVAGHYRVGAKPQAVDLTATLADIGALDGDAIVYYPAPSAVPAGPRR